MREIDPGLVSGGIEQNDACTSKNRLRSAFIQASFTSVMYDLDNLDAGFLLQAFNE